MFGNLPGRRFSIEPLDNKAPLKASAAPVAADAKGSWLIT